PSQMSASGFEHQSAPHFATTLMNPACKDMENPGNQTPLMAFWMHQHQLMQ
ncbi:hypothetical protein A2U01_0104625, partial [Trifolium medium]|nr:hypothetical protein [Trifolium medium]